MGKVPGLMHTQEVMERFVDSLKQQGFIESEGTESVTPFVGTG